MTEQEPRFLTFRVEPTGELWRRILTFAVGRFPAILFVERDEAPVEDRSIIEALRPALVDERRSSRWPGTQLYGAEATVWRHRLDADVARRLVGAAEGLYRWLAPDLPEDLCILRADGTAWLGSIAHEETAWLSVTAAEWAAVSAAIPELASAVDEDD